MTAVEVVVDEEDVEVRTITITEDEMAMRGAAEAAAGDVVTIAVLEVEEEMEEAEDLVVEVVLEVGDVVEVVVEIIVLVIKPYKNTS